MKYDVALVKRILIGGVLLFGAACSETPQLDTTSASAATGGVLGAGLGAIVGSQTGSAGGGLLIGAAAGIATGALIGQTLESQQHAEQTQAEALTRQEQQLDAQRKEIAALRKLNGQDSGRSSYASSSSDVRASYRQNNSQAGRIKLNPPANYNRASASSSNPAPARMASGSVQSEQPARASIPVQNRDVITSSAGVNQGTQVGAIQERDVSMTASTSVSTRDVGGTEVTTIKESVTESVAPDEQSGCSEALSEAEKADAATDSADKLFHYRRALRLCPGQAQYHIGLGQTYIAMNRKQDAQAEFQEALRIDPDSREATDLLSSVTAKGSKSSSSSSSLESYDRTY